MREFSDILNEALEKHERTRGWLARKTGISRTTINDYCAGKTNPRFDKALQIAKILNIDLAEIFNPEEVKEIKTKEKREKYISTIRKEGVVEIPLFPTGADLLSALNQSKNGYSIGVAMARERIVVPEKLAREGAFAIKVDHIYDRDEEFDTVVIWPWGGQVKKNGMILFTTDPPRELFLRRVILQEDQKFILKKSYKENNVITTDEIAILGEVRYKIEEI